VTALWALGLLYVLFGVACAGALWERERLLNADGDRDLRWWGALLLSAALWPVVGLLWGPSRPASPQPGAGVDTETEQLPPPAGYTGSLPLYVVPSASSPDAPPDGFLVGRVVEVPRHEQGWEPVFVVVASYGDLLRVPGNEGQRALVQERQGMTYLYVDGQWRVMRDEACDKCDTDRHVCPGCGEPLYHYRVLCKECEHR
jgi:hypothetical protein